MILSRTITRGHGRACFAASTTSSADRRPSSSVRPAARVFDVVVDLRRGSPTFGRWVGAELSEENRRMLYAPAGFGHGFLVLSEIAEFQYKCSDFYAPDEERGIRWDDPSIAIDWPLGGLDPDSVGSRSCLAPPRKRRRQRSSEDPVMTHSPRSMLVTGGAGFIGCNYLSIALEADPELRVVNLDALTYAGHPASQRRVAEIFGERYALIEGDIRDAETVRRVFSDHAIDTVVHFAAESHVDRSIDGPLDFIDTNIRGTANLLEAARAFWGDRRDVRFHHISTDEVFGSLGAEGFFTEDTPYDPSSPYSASKAASDHLVRAWQRTYGLPVTLSNCSNNYGPYQFPEKLIPLIIANAVANRPLPVYGDGSNIRDWLFVEDHCRAIDLIVRRGQDGTDLQHRRAQREDQSRGRPRDLRSGG